MIKNLINNVKDSIKDFKQDPIENLAFLVTVGIGLNALINGIIAYILFISRGGYTAQIQAVKEYGIFQSYEGKYTTGTTGMIIGGVAGKILIALLLVEFILLMFTYFKNTGIAKKIIMIIDLGVTGVRLIISLISYLCAMQGSNMDGVPLLFGGNSLSVQKIIMINAIVTLCTIAIFFILILTIKACRWMLGYSAIALLMALALIPLIVLILENIIPIATGILAFIIVGIIVVAVIWAVTRSTGAPNPEKSASWNSSESHSGSKKGGQLSERGERKRKNDELVIEEHCAYIPNYKQWGGFKLYKVHGHIEDYIETDNGFLNRKICSLELYNNGKFHIYEAKSRREIITNEIPWR